jgi:hypothetical protein
LKGKKKNKTFVVQSWGCVRNDVFNIYVQDNSRQDD